MTATPSTLVLLTSMILLAPLTVEAGPLIDSRTLSALLKRDIGLSDAFDTKRAASLYSPGGGSRLTIPEGKPFAGRSIGGARRRDIYGTSRFGSGYPLDYSAAGVSEGVVAGQHFPFGFYPLYWPNNYAGSQEYQAVESRPGGKLVRITLQSDEWPLADFEKKGSYVIVGDTSSVEETMQLLIKPSLENGCGVKSAEPETFEIDADLGPQNVLQWYRASSFALAFTDYENTSALSPLNTTTPLTEHAAYPTGLDKSELFSCLNKTLGKAVPIMDDAMHTPPSSDGPLWFILAGVLGALFLVQLVIVAFCLRGKYKLKQAKKLNQAESLHPADCPDTALLTAPTTKESR